MTPELHPGLDDLILYCMGTPDASSNAGANDQLRRHVEECGECRAQAKRLCTEMSLVIMAVPQVTPPAAAKERLMRMVLAESQHSATASAAPIATAGEASGNAESSNILPMKPRRHSPGLVWGGWVAAAACLFYAIQLRDANQGMRQQLRTETAEIIHSHTSAARAEEVLDVLSSPRAQRVTLVAAHAKPEPTGHAVYLQDRGALVFTASNLTPLPPNKTYELWVIPADGNAPIAAGTFQPDARGMASVLLPKLPHGVQAKAFGVTMENSGGATTPTMPILLAGG